MPNRLINEKSPYLLQHAHNPVDWRPWGDEAFEAARREDKPIFLSVGYATCHWCHVMERESFEDDQAAEALNRSFVCIKVDREEYPDIDAVYMAACHLVTGSGGWPLSIVMTPDKKPFFAGTYLPKNSAGGRFGLMDLCAKISELWRQDRERVITSAHVVSDHMQGAFAFEAHPDIRFESGVIAQAADSITQRYDEQYGGFDSAPKFPMAHRLLFLLNQQGNDDDRRVLQMTSHTLEAMRQGGIWDHVGFGFHRYATDRQWLLPHFEKMLYDQALLAMVYLKAFEVTGSPLFEQTAREIFTYVLRDMTDVSGAFFTAEDADSEGEEGKFYLWSQDQFDILTSDLDGDLPWRDIFNLAPDGNFLDEATHRKTGTNILHMTRDWPHWARQLQMSPASLSAQWEMLRQRLFEQRIKRVPPLKDDKILTDWNGLMIAALAMGAEVLDEPDYAAPAAKAATFLLERMVDDRGRLLHRYRKGDAAIAATANDYAYLIMGLVGLFRTDGSAHWREHAQALQRQMDANFWDGEKGGYFLTAHDGIDLPVRPKEGYDGAMPSANGVALNNLIALDRLTGRKSYRQQADRLIQALGGSVRKQPGAYLHTLNGWMARLKDS